MNDNEVSSDDQPINIDRSDIGPSSRKGNVSQNELNVDLKVVTEVSEPHVRYEHNPSTGRDGVESPILYDAPLKPRISPEAKTQLEIENQALQAQQERLFEQLNQKDDESDQLRNKLLQEEVKLSNLQKTHSELKRAIDDFFSVVSTSEEKEKKAVTQLCRLLGFDELKIQAVFKSFKKKKGFF